MFCKHRILPHVHPSNLRWSPVPSPKLRVPASEGDSHMAAAVLVSGPQQLCKQEAVTKGTFLRAGHLSFHQPVCASVVWRRSRFL